jgi:TRAP-type C4-dicarboxylate transport system permease small subunit
VLTVASVTGRYGFGTPVPGDYELVEIICAVAIFLFFPYTHATDGNISAEFFTSGLSLRHRRILDAVHDVVFAVIAAMLAWRLGHGLVDKFHSGDMSILIHIPLWWAYSFAVLSMALLAVICVWRIVAVIGMLRR